MRRSHNQPKDVILFVGQCNIITLMDNRRIGFTSRTILLQQKVILTYVNPLPSITKFQQTKDKQKRDIPLQNLTSHQHEYYIKPKMRPKLLLGRKDPGVQAFLQQLGIPPLPKHQLNVVAITNDEDRCMNGFVFEHQTTAAQFYAALKVAVATQIYSLVLPKTMSFNHKVSNFLGDTLNGRCTIDPLIFMEGQQDLEVEMMQEMLKGLQDQQIFNLQGKVQMKLQFKISDERSCKYASDFISCFSAKTAKLSIQGCELTSAMLGQIFNINTKIAQKMKRLSELNLSKNTLTDDCLAPLTLIVSQVNSLTMFDLSNNAIKLQRQPLLYGFLTAIQEYKVSLNLSKNRISSSRLINKFILAAQGTIPIYSLDISDNPIPAQQISAMAKLYMQRTKNTPPFDLQLHLDQLELDQAYAFEFLQEQCWSKRPKTMSIPLAISRHAQHRVNKEIAQKQADSNTIDDTLKNYSRNILLGQLYQAQLQRKQLKQLGLQEDTITSQTIKAQFSLKQQQEMLVKKIEKCLNYTIQPEDIPVQMAQALRFARKKGVLGQGVDCLAYIKHRFDCIISQWIEQNKIGQVYRESLLDGPNRYARMYRQGLLQLPSYLQIVKMNEQQLQQLFLYKQHSSDIDVTIIYQYLMLANRPQKYYMRLAQTCLTHPQLSSAKIVRYDLQTSIIFEQVPRVQAEAVFSPSSRLDFISRYGIQTYNFSQGFIQSGQSTSAYAGMLSKNTCRPQQQKIVVAFVQICKNFLSFLYLTPLAFSQDAAVYLGYITQYLTNLQGEEEKQFAQVLIEQLVLHLITYFDSKQHQPLKKGILHALVMHISRRVTLPQEMANRLTAYLLRTDPQNEPSIHQRGVKIDWKVRDQGTLQYLIQNNGRLRVQIADGQAGVLLIIQVDELYCVWQLWDEVKKRVEELNRTIHLPQKDLQLYWLYGEKGGEWVMLPSYEHIGKLFFKQGFSRKFQIRRIIFLPQEYSMTYLSELSYDHLLAIYRQAHQNFKDNAQFIDKMTQKIKEELTVLSIWIDVLVQQYLRVGMSRRQDEESRRKNRMERQTIVNQRISQLHRKYLPRGMVLDEQGRMRVIASLMDRQHQPNKKIQSNKTQQTQQQSISAVLSNILSFMRLVGKCCYTIYLPDSHQQRFLLINNHQITFVDRTQAQIQTLQISIANLLWFQVVPQPQPSLRFQFVQSSSSTQLNVRRVIVNGQNLWISQCLSFIVHVAWMRLAYDAQTMAQCQDSQGLSSIKIIKKTVYRPEKSPGNLSKYYKFTLQNINIQTQNKETKIVQPRRLKQQSSEPVIQQKEQNIRNNQPVVSQPQRFEPEGSPNIPKTAQKTAQNVQIRAVPQQNQPVAVLQPQSSDKQQVNSSFLAPKLPQATSVMQAITQQQQISSKISRSSKSNYEIEDVVNSAGAEEDTVRGRRRSSNRKEPVKRRSGRH